MYYHNVCTLCRHLGSWKEGQEPDDPEAAPPCTAFPEGIPVEIWRDGADHRVEFEGDNGVRFEPARPISVDKLDALIEYPKRRREIFERP